MDCLDLQQSLLKHSLGARGEALFLILLSCVRMWGP